MDEEIAILNLARPVLVTGTPLNKANAAMVMIHGRGASASDMLSLVPALNTSGFAYLAPEAPGHQWYPRPFTAPLEANEPYLSASLALIGEILSYLAKANLSAERTILLGFSQGACLSLEYAARNAKRYGGIVGLSGGLIGPDGLERADGGSLNGSPVFFGCSDVDPHIPAYRVTQAGDYLRRLGGSVTVRFYPRMGHTVNDDEITFVRSFMAAIRPETSKDSENGR